MCYNYTGQYRRNRIGKWASVRSHGNPKGTNMVSYVGNAMWLVGNCMHLSVIKE